MSLLQETMSGELDYTGSRGLDGKANIVYNILFYIGVLHGRLLERVHQSDEDSNTSTPE